MADREDKPQLQRRGGRRISIPSSPVSPSVLKRYDRFYRSPEALNYLDPSPATERSADAPSIDLRFPSPLLDGHNFGHATDSENKRKSASIHMMTTEQTPRNNDFDQTDGARKIPTSSRASEARQSQPSRPPFLSDGNTKNSPVIGRVSEGRDRNFDTSVSGGRNYSTTSLSTDRSASDENISAKAPIVKKSRLNKLNPMNLLARRQSSHNTKLEEMNVNVTPLQVPAIPDFDPSIRGSFVHDFSTPRSKRSHLDNSPRPDTLTSPVNWRRPSDYSASGAHLSSSLSPTLHSPLFREHFQDEDKSLQPGQTAYLHNVTASHKFFDAPSSAALPSFAQKLPAKLPQLGPVKEDKELPPLKIPHPDEPPPPPPKRTPSPRAEAPSASAIPKHMTSVSSRFSFQISGHGSSAQEKLLEEKHKEHHANGLDKLADTHNPNGNDDDEEDDFDFDVDDDFEERIPGVNTDLYEEDDFGTDDIPVRNIELPSSHQQPPVQEQPLYDFHFTPAGSTFSLASPDHGSEPTPRDMEGFAIGIANSKDSPNNPAFDLPQQNNLDEAFSPLFLEGLRISTSNEKLPIPAEVSPPTDLISKPTFDDSDLYFDDGEFDMDEGDFDGHFDENLLDDESGHIRDIPAENAKKYQEAVDRGGPMSHVAAVDDATGISRDTSSSSNFVDIRGAGSSGFASSREHELASQFPGQPSGLTEGNLAAYHDALAEAAQYAAANGKFNRQVSFRSDTSEEINQYQSREAPTNPTTHESQSQNDANSEYLNDFDPYTFDDEIIDDDLMIAEANAEALENDDEGFYGQEFGFYARAHGKDISELINGGFFAARGSNGVKRSHSGKANFQEPSLTPITERSEWSARNSIASLPVHAGFPLTGQSLPSPGISQVIESPLFEDDMTLSALIKLRRSAFGGSSTSINSLGERSMPGSSPLANVSGYLFPQSESTHLAKHSIGSSTSIPESEGEEDGDMGQPTLTQNTPRKKATGTSSPTTPHANMIHLAVTEAPSTKRRINHRRNSSGADSVSYIRDKDGHWVLERRRTGDDGEQEVVEREYLAGARI